jgi:hypothetical protein
VEQTTQQMSRGQITPEEATVSAWSADDYARRRTDGTLDENALRAAPLAAATQGALSRVYEDRNRRPERGTRATAG